LKSSGRPREGIYTIVEYSLLKCTPSDTVARARHPMTATLDEGHPGVVGGEYFGRSGTVTFVRVGQHGLDGTADIDMCPMSTKKSPIHVHATFALR
jgi:hypothetical protein